MQSPHMVFPVLARVAFVSLFALHVARRAKLTNARSQASGCTGCKSLVLHVHDDDWRNANPLNVLSQLLICERIATGQRRCSGAHLRLPPLLKASRRIVDRQVGMQDVSTPVKSGELIRERSRKKDRQPPKEIEGEECNVAVTHINADFDSLAAAVALAKIWQVERPQYPTFVCLPSGSNPVVKHYITQHKSLIPVRGFRSFRPEDIQAVGILDTADVRRIGRASDWLDHAKHIELFDHHTIGPAGDIPVSNIKYDKLTSDTVGSVTTLLVEKLRALHERLASSAEGNPLALNEAELTLFALGIHSDTLNLIAKHATPRDYEALSWLMQMGASQSAIAEFGNARPSLSHGENLAVALNRTVVVEHEGLRVGTVVGNFGANGGAYLAYDVLGKLSLDAVLFGSFSVSRQSHAHLSVIGRSSHRAPVDLNVIMSKYGGGGHVHAASITFNWKANSSTSDKHPEMTLEETLMDAVVERMDALKEDLLKQIPKQPIAQELMTKDVFYLSAHVTMEEADKSMRETDIKSIPIVDDQHKLVGMIKKPKVVHALRQNLGAKSVKSAMSRAHSIHGDTPLSAIENELQSSTRLCVVDDQNRLVGMLTGTDVLKHRNYYSLQNWHKGYSWHAKEVEADTQVLES